MFSLSNNIEFTKNKGFIRSKFLLFVLLVFFTNNNLKYPGNEMLNFFSVLLLGRGGVCVLWLQLVLVMLTSFKEWNR